MNGRAITSEQKRAVMERLLAAWEKMPEQRLGQLLINASDYHGVPLFFVEDATLVSAAEHFVGPR